MEIGKVISKPTKGTDLPFRTWVCDKKHGFFTWYDDNGKEGETSMMVCDVCGGNSIQGKVWMNVNTERIYRDDIEYVDDDKGWCDDCLELQPCSDKRFKSKEEVIAYLVKQKLK